MNNPYQPVNIPKPASNKVHPVIGIAVAMGMFVGGTALIYFVIDWSYRWYYLS